MNTTTTTTSSDSGSDATNMRPGGRGRGPGRAVAPVQDTAVRFSVWGPQPTTVRASSGGGRDEAPYLSVTVGNCLTYAYDTAAADCYLAAWTEAVHIARSLRLPEQPPLTGQRTSTPGQDFAVACTVRGQQHTSVHGHVTTGRPTLTVAVGSVTVQVHTASAAVSYLAAWNRAATATALLESE